MKKFISLLLAIVTVSTMVSMTTTVFATEDNVQLPMTDVSELTSETVEETEVEVTTEPAEASTDATEATDPTEATEVTETTEATEATTETVAPTTKATEATTKATQPTTVKKVTPKPIKGFKVAKRSTSALKLSWKKATKNTTHYVIYRSVEKSNGKFTAYKKYKVISKLSKTAFTDKNLKSGYVYKYKIYAFNKTKTYKTHSSGVAVKGVVKMLVPKIVKVAKATTSYITIKWSKVSGARKYWVYRTGSDGKETLVAKTAENSYKDTKITSGNTYKYRIKGYRVVSKKTYTSPSKSVTAAAGINSVGSISASSYLNRALLTWSAVSGASGYDIYAINSKGDYVFKETRSYPTYLSGKAKAGKTYKFAVKAFKTVSGQKVYSGTKLATVTITDKAYGQTVSGTWVEVCTETQQMYMYVNNKLYCSTPVVTGNAGALATTHGYHKVISRKSPAILRGSYGSSSWNTKVNYWLGFTSDGQGIHDSTWRTSGYGGEIYKGNGSHGCVNTPYAAAGKIYNKAYLGMPVIVY
jgi:hypothetical protein